MNALNLERGNKKLDERELILVFPKNLQVLKTLNYLLNETLDLSFSLPPFKMVII